METTALQCSVCLGVQLVGMAAGDWEEVDGREFVAGYFL